jgi:GNAT superfamily N-acetyltransferase
MNIKSVDLESLEKIIVLNTEIFTPLYKWPLFTLEEYQERLQGKNPYILVAENNGIIIADSISFERDKYWYIWILGTASQYRGQGIATRLFEMNEVHAKILGYEKVRIKIYGVSKEMLNLVIKREYKIIETIESSALQSKAYIVELELKKF